MSTSTTEMPEAATAALAEATRIAEQAARNGTENANASLKAANTYFDETSAIPQDLLGSWTTQSEAAVKAAFEAQNAAIDAGLGLFDMTLKGNRQAVEQFSALVKRTQQATLEAWTASVKMATKATETPKR
jgi:hypothetical protein